MPSPDVPERHQRYPAAVGCRAAAPGTQRRDLSQQGSEEGRKGMPGNTNLSCYRVKLMTRLKKKREYKHGK